jgi:hypothetical protein
VATEAVGAASAVSSAARTDRPTLHLPMSADLPCTWAYPTLGPTLHLLAGMAPAGTSGGRYIDRCKDRPTYPILARAGRPTLHLPAGTAPVGATGTVSTAARTDRPTLHSRRKTERLKTGAGWAADLPYTYERAPRAPRPAYPILAHVDRPTLHLRAPVEPTYPVLAGRERTCGHPRHPTLGGHLQSLGAPRQPPRAPTDLPYSALPSPQARPTYLPYTSPLPGQSGGRGQVRSAYPTPPAPKAAERFPLRHPLYPPAVRGKVREI